MKNPKQIKIVGIEEANYLLFSGDWYYINSVATGSTVRHVLGTDSRPATPPKKPAFSD